jgi:hypothetical protein
MVRLVIICEGPTEANFVKQNLAAHLADFEVYASPSILKQPVSKRHSGGRVTVERLITHIAHEYHGCDFVSTLVDFYGFQDRDNRDCAQLTADIVTALSKKLNTDVNRKFLPYVQMHEFEGLLFSDVAAFDCVIDQWDNEIHAQLKRIRDTANPEDINDSPATAPSKRLYAIFGRGYSKTEHGPLIAQKIGLTTIRKECPLFSGWLVSLEQLSKKEFK